MDYLLKWIEENWNLGLGYRSNNSPISKRLNWFPLPQERWSFCIKRSLVYEQVIHVHKTLAPSFLCQGRYHVGHPNVDKTSRDPHGILNCSCFMRNRKPTW
jgi:hypothetical protein